MWTSEIPQRDGLYWLRNQRLGINTIAQVQYWQDKAHIRLLVSGGLSETERRSLKKNWEWWPEDIQPPKELDENIDPTCKAGRPAEEQV